MNPFLKGEKRRRQGGFNANAHDLLFKQDSFQLKAVYFETRIKNYISSQTYPVCKTARSATVRRRRRKSGITRTSTSA